MGRRVGAIIVIFLFSAFAWFILAASITSRTNSSDSALGPKVSATWGAPQTQMPPSATVVARMVESTVTDAGGIKRTVTTPEYHELPIDRSRINVALDLDQRQKGLLWFATYRVDFHGDYILRNDSDKDEVTVNLAFPVANAIYDNLIL